MTETKLVPKYPKILPKIVIFLLTVVLTFYALDLLLLRIDLFPCQLTAPDKIVRYSFIPHKTCTIKTGEFQVEYRINEHGLRDDSFTIQKPNNTFRILFLGDSFTEGQAVELSQTMVKRLQEELNSTSLGQKYQTINGGVAGYSTILEYLYLVERGIKFNPDLVIVNLNMTDFTEERASLKYAKRDKNGEIKGVFIERKRRLPQKLDDFLTSSSFLYNLYLLKEEKIINLKDRILAKLSQKPQPQHTKSQTDITPGDLDRDLFAITRDIEETKFEELFSPVTNRLLTMKQYLNGRQIPMIVTLIPNGHQIDKSQWSVGRREWQLTEEKYPQKINSRLAEFSQNNNMLFIDPTQDLKNYLLEHPDSRLYYELDGHFTPLAHQIVASGIMNFLKEHQLLESR